MGPTGFAVWRRKGKEIVLFGEGEERRDHILIEDVAELVCLCLRYRSQGVLNLATGTVVSFREIADQVVAHCEKSVAVKGSPRQGSMPHNGYRPFDAAATQKAFPEFHYTPVVEGLAKVHCQMLEAANG